ncbi:hypothetical protein BDV12DRAFT_176397 [Aspergillus spectabilis]
MHFYIFLSEIVALHLFFASSTLLVTLPGLLDSCNDCIRLFCHPPTPTKSIPQSRISSNHHNALSLDYLQRRARHSSRKNKAR